MPSTAALRSIVAITSLIFVLTPPLRAQGGYTTEKRKDLGISFPRAKYYEEIPTPPDEEFVVLYFAEKQEVTVRRERGGRPNMRVLLIDWFEDPDDPEEPEEPDDSGGDTPTEEGRSKSKSVKVEQKPITTLERWMERKFKKLELSRITESDRRPQGEYEGTEYEFVFEDSRWGGWAFAWRSPKTTVAVFGTCHVNDLAEQTKIWRKAAERMKITAPEGADRSKWDRHYERRNFIDPTFRANVRSRLTRGWSAEDTDNYIVVYSTPDQPLVRRICREMEQIRKAYVELFPPARPIEAVSTVRVCKSREEYTLYGGPPRSAGYWNWRDEELVLYDFQDESKTQRKDDSDTFIVLYHEAFHQYIYYSAGAVSPHSWFNEGHGDYFSGALIKGGKLKKIDLNPWRLPLIKRAVRTNNSVPFEDIIGFEQKDFYNPKIRSICYAQGWAMIYFLRDKKVIRAHPEWSHILETYFDVLKATWDEEYARAGKPEEPTRRGEIQLASRHKAVDAAFEGVDLRALESEWKDYVVELELPSSRRR